MKKKLLLFVLMLASFTGVRADDGTLSVENVRNVVPGYVGSLDLVLSGSTNLYAGYQFTLTLPEGLSFIQDSKGNLAEGSFAEGDMLDGHFQNPPYQGSVNNRTFLGYTLPPVNFKKVNGTLLTIYFNVDPSVTGTLTGGSLNGIVFSNINGSEEHNLAASAFSATVESTVSLDDDQPLEPGVTMNNVDISFNRSFKAGVWSTICWPFAMPADQVKAAFGDDVLVGDFNGYTVESGNLKVQFTKVDAIERNHPYIVKTGHDITSISATVDISPVADPSVNKGTGKKPKAMIGTFEPITLQAGMLYLKNNNFKYSTGSAKLKAYRAYFDFNDFDWEDPARLFLEFNETTGVKHVEPLVIDDADEVFNLQGQRVKEPVKGFYIVNGKKVMK